MLLEVNESQLVLVDYQDGLMPVIDEGSQVLANAQRLAQIAHRLKVPVWGTEQNPDKLGCNDPVIRSHCIKTLSKMAFSAAGAGLMDCLLPAADAPKGNSRSLPRHLQKLNPPPALDRTTIVMGGCEAHICLLQTALELLEQELSVWVVTDACGSRTERNRDAAFDRLASAGAELVTTEMVAFEWLRSAEHPAFRDVLAMIK